MLIFTSFRGGEEDENAPTLVFTKGMNQSQIYMNDEKIVELAKMMIAMMVAIQVVDPQVVSVASNS